MRISVDLKDSFDYCFENFVENFLDGDAIEERIGNIRNAFGRLLEHLVLVGSLDAEILSEILESRAVKFVHDVEIHGTHLVEGRGHILVIDCDPTIHIGHFIRSIGQLWRVLDIERQGKTMNVIVRGEGDDE